jgi:hypothetical protein
MYYLCLLYHVPADQLASNNFVDVVRFVAITRHIF